MLGFLGRFAREIARQVTAPSAPERTGGAATPSQAPSSATAQSSTRVNENGRGVELLILDSDPLDSPEFYLGDDPINPQGE